MNQLENNAILILKNIEITWEIDFDVIIKYLKKNSISLIDLYNERDVKKNNVFFDSTQFQKALQEEKNILEKWKSDFKPIKELWEKEGIEYILHKSIGNMPYLSGNLDVLVKQEDFEKASRILENFGYIDLRNIQEAHKKYYRKFDGNKELLPIHLHERVCWIVPFEDNEHIWKYYEIKKDDEMIHYPSVEDSIIIILAHHFLEDHTISLFDLVTLKKLIDSKNNIDWEFIENTTKKLKWDHSFYTAIVIFNHFYRKIFNEPIQLPKTLLKKSFFYINKHPWIAFYMYKNILKNNIQMPFKISHFWTRIHTALRELKDPTFGNKRDRFIQVFGGLLDRFIQLKLKIASHPGMMITFSGLDGSGKTTHIKNLQYIFKKCGITSKIVWNRTGSMFLGQFILKSYRFIKYGQTNKKEIIEKIREKDYTPKNNFTTLVWQFISLLDMILFYYLKIYFPVKLGKVKIVDRYFLDNMVDIVLTTQKDTKLTLFLFKLLKKILPKPDIKIFLEVSIDIAKKRAKDETELDLKKKKRLYEKFLMYDKDVWIVDNTKNLGDVENLIYKKVLKLFFDKYPEKFKGYKVVSWRYK